MSKLKLMLAVALCVFALAAERPAQPADAARRKAEAKRRKLEKQARDSQSTKQAAPLTMASVRERLALARETLEYVERSAARPRLAAELQAAAGAIESADPQADPAALFERIAELRRRIVLSHPALDFERLLINKNPPPLYSHNCDQYLGRHSRAGRGYCVIRKGAWDKGLRRAK